MAARSCLSPRRLHSGPRSGCGRGRTLTPACCPGRKMRLEPFWSPDSRLDWVLRRTGRLKKVAVSGGTVQTIAGGTSDPRGASWGADDTILFGTGSGGVYRVAAAGGTAQAVTELDSSRQEGSHRWPQFLPDGRHFLFTVRSGLADQRGVYVSTLGGTTRHLLIRSDGNARYAAPGYVLFLDEDTLLAQSFDHERLELVGQPIPIAVARRSKQPGGRGLFNVERGDVGLRGRHPAAGTPDLVRPRRKPAGRGRPGRRTRLRGLPALPRRNARGGVTG